MIQIDDAGWGCLVGGVLLGIYSKETGEYAYREIPINIFHHGNFTAKAYLKIAYQLTPDLLDALKVPPDEPTTGPLQEKIKATFLKKLNQIGITGLTTKPSPRSKGFCSGTG